MDPSPQTVSYVICTNPRSGSWLLSEALSLTALAGNPREWLNNIEEQLHCTEWAIDRTGPAYASYLDRILECGKTTNGIFGIKLHYYQFAELPEKVASLAKYQGITTCQLMSALFPHTRYIWLKRHDTARQAVSYYRACKTGEWWLIDGALPERSNGTVNEVAFAPKAIQKLEQMLIQNDHNWQLYFESNDITPLTIDYEDLVVNYTQTILTVLKWLEIPNVEASLVSPPRLKRQWDSRNEEWLALYLKFKAEAENQLPYLLNRRG
jgi:trehalose 2-sulfotransferase